MERCTLHVLIRHLHVEDERGVAVGALGDIRGGMQGDVVAIVMLILQVVAAPVVEPAREARLDASIFKPHPDDALPVGKIEVGDRELGRRRRIHIARPEAPARIVDRAPIVTQRLSGALMCEPGVRMPVRQRRVGSRGGV